MFYSQRSIQLFSFAQPYIRYLSPGGVNKINEVIEFARGKGDVNSALSSIGLQFGDSLGGDMYSISRIGQKSMLNVELEDMRNGRFIARHLNIQIPQDAEPLHKKEEPKESEKIQPQQLKLF